MMQLAPLLKIGRGVTAVIGGGGKTTLLATLADELSAHGRVLLCTTTKIWRFEQFTTLLSPTEEAVRRTFETQRILCAASAAPRGKLTAPELPIKTLAALCDYVLVEADGSKGLPLKAHESYEPVIPAEAQRVVLVMGADGLGQPISAVCHRPALYAQKLGVDADTLVTPRLAAQLVQQEGFHDRVFINKMESPADYGRVEELGKELSCPVVAGSLHKGVFVCLH